MADAPPVPAAESHQAMRSLHHQQPVLIPIVGAGGEDGDIPEWAMIEVNGEFLPPLQEPARDPGSSSSTDTAAATSSTSMCIGEHNDVDNDNNNNAAAVFSIDPRTIELGSLYFRDPVRSFVSQRTFVNEANDFLVNLAHCINCFILSMQKSPVLVVGTHELQGVIQDLAQPFVCLQPTTTTTLPHSSSSSTTTAILDGSVPPIAKENDTSTSYVVAGVVRRKLLFNQYPKTLLR